MSKEKQDTVVGGVEYRENVVLGIVDKPETAQTVGRALTSGGFLESEVALGCGEEWADRVRASSGRSGLIGRVLQVLDRFGAGGDEMDMKHEYEQAMRTGQCTVAVFAPTKSVSSWPRTFFDNTEAVSSTSWGNSRSSGWPEGMTNSNI